MQIAELYSSLQGEGLLTGTPSVFVRSSGCNLRCWFCDTPYTSWEPEGEDWSVEEIVAEVQRLADMGASGEPCTAGVSLRPCTLPFATSSSPAASRCYLPNCSPLCGWGSGLHLTIETAGTLFLPVRCDLMSISPKLASSTPSLELAGKWSARHEQTRHQPEVIRRLTSKYEYQLKFVIDSRADLEDVQDWLAEFPHIRRERVLLMPQGIELAALAAIGQWLEPYCREQGFVFCPRKHIEW
jgi:7-carboxy-7-deazaguanine synthase